MWWSKGLNKSGDGEQGRRRSLLEDHCLWIRFMAVSARHLATGRLELVACLPSCSFWWDVMDQTCSALPGVVVWSHSQTPQFLGWRGSSLLPHPLSWSQTRPLMGELMNSCFPCRPASNHCFYFKPGAWHLPEVLIKVEQSSALNPPLQILLFSFLSCQAFPASPGTAKSSVLSSHPLFFGVLPWQTFPTLWPRSTPIL